MNPDPRFARLVEMYTEKTSESRRLHKQAGDVYPGGDTRSVLFVEPYPVYMARRQGVEVHDVDGNVYIDALNNFTSLIHGGRTEHIVASIREQLDAGFAFGSPTTRGVELGSLLLGRLDGMERIRFCNSGTEAVMHTIRAARAYTGRSKVLMFRHGYHGSHELTALLENVTKVGDRSGAIQQALDGTGVPPSTYSEALIAPFNDLRTTTAIATQFAGDLAAILVEPMQNAAGCIPGELDFLAGLIELGHELGAMVIFDEVVTLRLAKGGLQGALQLTPDITALGKIIGGGLPIGAFGGKAAVMENYEPGRRVQQSGTFNAFPLSMAAGLVAMREYDEEAIDRLNKLGELFARQLGSVIAGVESKSVMAGAPTLSGPPTLSGQGSLWTLTWPKPIPQADAAETGPDLQLAFYLACMIHGVQIAPRGMFALSTAMDESSIGEILARTNLAIKTMSDLGLCSQKDELERSS